MELEILSLGHLSLIEVSLTMVIVDLVGRFPKHPNMLGMSSWRLQPRALRSSGFAIAVVMGRYTARGLGLAKEGLEWFPVIPVCCREGPSWFSIHQ